MTHFLADILRQPEELRRMLNHLRNSGQDALRDAATAIRNAREIYLTGVGASWNAALSVLPLFTVSGCRVYMQETPELLHFARFSAKSVVIVLSRSGKSIEVVNLLTKARTEGATVIGITCSEEGTLAKEAQLAIVLPTKLDHAISVNTYTSLAGATAALASVSGGHSGDRLIDHLLASIDNVEQSMPDWRARVEESAWIDPDVSTYFLGRGCSVGSCHEARLLWEEGAKAPATAMGTGSFRHGPQEIVNAKTHFGVWIDGAVMREQDLAVASDLQKLGARVMLVGQRLPSSFWDLAFEIPAIAPDWQFLVDVIPAQLCAESFARQKGVDPDSFLHCSYIVDGEYGLLPRREQS
jgi:glucosamine--fructose-6-phosphate aminotransferase (isomerizing)